MATPAHPPRSSNLTSPPTNHTLRPHHLQLLQIMAFIYHPFNRERMPRATLLNVTRFLLEQVAEVRSPPSFLTMRARYMLAIKGFDPIARVHDDIWDPTFHISNPTYLTGLLGSLPSFYNGEGRIKFTARSMFGHFVRRCFITHLKLSYEGLLSLFSDYSKWTRGEPVDHIYVKKDILSNAYTVLKMPSDKREYARPEAYAMWEKSVVTGDDVMAAESIRRYFEQYFHEGNDSGLRQHSLFMIAELHYLRHEHVACRKLLEEAITVARTNNDRRTLQRCISLLNRLPPLERNRKMVINEIQPDLHPSEALYDVKKLLIVGNQQPLSAAFERITQVGSLQDMWADTRHDEVLDSEQWGQNAVRSVVWSMLGSAQLADLEEEVIMRVSSPQDNQYTTAICNKAHRMARQGAYEESIAMLLTPHVWENISMADYERWAMQIWHILMLRASRRGQIRMIHDFLWPKRFTNGASLKEYTYTESAPLNSVVRDPLHEVLSMREANQGHSTIQPLLTSLWHSEFQQRYETYRPGIILLADVGLEFGLTKWCRRIMEEIMPQLIIGDDLEQRAYACFTLARCIIAAADSQEDALREAIFYLDIAEKDYKKIELFRSLQDTQFLLSVVYHNLNMIAERNEVAERHRETEKLANEVKAMASEDWIVELFDIVSDVGSALASRTSS
ncbi:hypothetical protein BDW22DRAFT_1358540 [Trametopsis cervina]|nr:hypothetical protein BDW22DRAFT_1358540 [Trametopsis cervina]